MIIRAVTRVCGFSCLFLERPARAMDPEKESWRTCMKMSPPLESQRPSCVRSVLFISTYAFIHTSKWSHNANVSFCTWNTKTRGFFVLFFGEKFVMWRTRLLLRCGAVLSSADVRNTSTSVDHHRFILLAWNCITGKDRRVFPIVHGEYLDRIFSPSAATWQEETDLSM